MSQHNTIFKDASSVLKSVLKVSVENIENKNFENRLLLQDHAKSSITKLFECSSWISWIMPHHC